LSGNVLKTIRHELTLIRTMKYAPYFRSGRPSASLGKRRPAGLRCHRWPLPTGSGLGFITEGYRRRLRPSSLNARSGSLALDRLIFSKVMQFFVTDLEMKNLQNQIDCRQPLNEGWLRWEPGFGTL
jgi:hypothetical protein